MRIEKNEYQSPEMLVTDLCAENMICASGTEVTVTDPWTGNVEQEW